MIRLHRESSEQNDRKIGSFTKPRKIKNTQTMFMFYLFLVTADYKRKTNEINDIWLKCQRKVEKFQKGLAEKLVNIQWPILNEAS